MAAPGVARQSWRVTPLRSALTRLLYISFGFFLAGFFVFPEARQRFWCYCWLVLVPFLPFARATARHMRRQQGPILALLFIAYMTATTLWSDGGGWQCTGSTVAQGLMTASFMAVIIMLAHEYGDRFQWLLGAVAAGAAVSGLVAVFVWYAGHPFPESRLVSFSKLNNPVLVGLAYGPFALLAAACGFSSQSVSRRTVFFAIFVTLSSVILLTQSRNVLIAALAGLGVLIWYWRRSRLVLVVVSCLAFIGVLGGGWIYARFGQGIGYRMEVWRSAVAQIAEAPLAGHGYCSDNTVSASGVLFVHAHSAYLTAARDGGLIGLVLLILLLAQALRDAVVKLRLAGDPVALALVVYAAICLFPDTDRLLTPPKEAWLYFWLPVAFAWAKKRHAHSVRQTLPLIPAAGPRERSER